jgi:hypothetical protein
MTPLKLATIALGLAALVGGAFLVTHNPMAGGALLAAGGKLLGLALPEVGKKKPESDQLDDTQHFGPLLVLLFLALAVHQQGCSSVPITNKRCSFDNLEYSAHVATCRREIEVECLLTDDGTPLPSCPAFMKCEAWRKEQCE